MPIVFRMIPIGVTIMYITKNRNANYYTRIGLPKYLRASGYPSEMRFSLYKKSNSGHRPNCYSFESSMPLA
ncbi:hypothetical protein VSU01S_20650 [Vibrio superstes NBRC 103154]|uniref:Uncharacterized protein n=1 Tax=Vibrio superstes NBRC 103154 TaxID=1219062 RepID=A0A511QR71_9VIBR|nr:hypothetical protein VSU01S_20650 [Vibrio superstes NBRC 103154]